MNCTEQLLSYSRQRIQRDELKRSLAFVLIGATVGMLIAIAIIRSIG